MVTTGIRPVITTCSVWEAVRDELAVHNHLAGALKDGPPSDIYEGSARCGRLVLRAACKWLPGLLSVCGLPESVSDPIAALTTVQEMSDAAGELFTAVVEVDLSAADYTAFCALSDARWIADNFQEAVCYFLGGQDDLRAGDIASADECFAWAARCVVRIAANKTAPKTNELMAWLREEQS